MPNYVYQGRDTSGGSVAGRIQAASLQEAGRLLRADGKIILDLHEQSGVEGPPVAAVQRVRRDDVMQLTHQLAVMVDTGVPLTEALDGIAEQTAHTGVQALVRDIGDQVKGGMPLSDALSRHPKHFNNLYLATVRASEATGRMGSMLHQLSEYLRGQREMRKQIRGAMVYPLVMLAFSLLVLVTMLGFILPRFRAIYAGKEAVLPAPTRFLLGLGDFVSGQWLALLGGVTVAGVAAAWYLGSPGGRRMLDAVRLHVPLAAPMYQKLYVSRALRTLATMITSGVTLLDGLEITAAVVGNTFHREMWLRIRERLKEGRTLTDELFASRLVPHGVAQMVASGEKSGRLASVMERVADYCETDLRIGIKALTGLIEPAMIVLMGAFVGAVAIALLLPVFSISKVVAH